MSTTSNEVMQKVDSVFQSQSFPKWVGSFLEKAFFEKCPSHDLQKNELNRYCITCDASICRYCITSGCHNNHKILIIYRYIYQNVVPLKEMAIHIDCDKIQPYKSNKKQVVSLTPLRHSGSGSLIECAATCNSCKRKLTDPDRFRFCSIACKDEVVQPNQSKCEGAFQHTEGTSQQKDKIEQPNPSRRKRSRKGVPHRAPFF
ncbi:hypothetical protein DH2020_048318 [Rehmannia glutinosa]|uniref:B box-type domain-containing protein n=1 Tax=Rehmannia glutinosa TaxID=99300 RepID=A0ABR0U5W5_REHGL